LTIDPCYTTDIHVTADAIDGNGHVNNAEFVRWMNDVAVAHAEREGWSAATRAAGAAWVARSHHIEYLRPAFLGERVRARTWVVDVRGARSRRRYRFERAGGGGSDGGGKDGGGSGGAGGGDNTLLAEAETEFAFVDAQTGRPRRVPEELIALFRPALAGEGGDADAR
jgi:acyl-CoA thioester hydrolase